MKTLKMVHIKKKSLKKVKWILSYLDDIKINSF